MCTRYAQHRACEVELSQKIEIHTTDKCSIIHSLLTYKLATKPLEIKNQLKKAQTFPKPTKTIKKSTTKKFIKITKICAKGYTTCHPTPKSHNVLIGSQRATTNNRNT